MNFIQILGNYKNLSYSGKFDKDCSSSSSSTGNNTGNNIRDISGSFPLLMRSGRWYKTVNLGI